MSAEWTKAYYATGKRVIVDGAPAWRPKWWGELGNDKEYREATRDRLNPAHYPEGTIRIVRNGIPFRFAAHVKKWKPGNRAALCQGYDPFGLTMIPHPKGRLQYRPAAAFEDHYGDKAWQLSYRRRSAEERLGKWQAPPDLFVWARRERKKQRARLAGAQP